MNEIVDDLAQEHEALMQFVYMAPVGLLQAHTDGEIVMINPVAAQLMMPLSHDGTLSNLFSALEDIAPDLQHRLKAFTEPHGMVCDGVHLPALTGRGATAERRLLSFSLLKLDDSRIMALLQDITWQAKRERLLKQQEAWLNAILTGVSDYAIVGLDSQGQVVQWNASVGRVTGFAADAIVGQAFSVFYPSDAITPERVQDRLNEASHSGWSMDDGWRARADGTRFWGSALIAPLRLVEGQLASAAVPGMDIEGEATYCLILRDMSEHRDAAEQARHAAVCDHLTGIGNRRAFFEAGELELRRQQQRPRPLSLVLFDADHFKKINDTFGHPAGDAVLCHLANTLRATFREVDVVARIGGEEFAVLLPSTDTATAQAAAQRLCRAMAAAPVITDAGEVPCTVSAGVATVYGGACNLDDLMKRADKALYAAKAAGRNTVCRDASNIHEPALVALA
jgi:diguanylate cyclase (GGDEF)-like protein/PAS domain S-box-containing protein